MIESCATEPVMATNKEDKFDPRNELLEAIEILDGYYLLDSKEFCTDLYETCYLIGDEHRLQWTAQSSIMLDTMSEYNLYRFAKLLLKNQEFQRVGHVLPFLDIERNYGVEYVRESDESNILQHKLNAFVDELSKDPYCENAYFSLLFGLAYKLLAKDSLAIEHLCSAIRQMPLMFDAWIKLRDLIQKVSDLGGFNLGSHWACDLYSIDALTRLGRTTDPSVVRTLFDSSFIFYRSTFVSRLRVIWSVERGHHDQAKTFYAMLKPHDIEIADQYSHIL
ncbi:hypothetical protein ACOME3_005259 [Neoechinorhynchus agilis]